MVYKVEKFGVRSGNTFKASGSKFLRRYRKQSFLVRQFISNRLEDTSSEFEALVVNCSVNENNIPYSLNKKGRWLLPEILKDDILHGDHRDDTIGIQLLERHKLNKSANCIGVYTTKGAVKEVSVTKSKRKHRRTGYMHAHSVLNANTTQRRRRRRQGRRNQVQPAEEAEQIPEERSQLRYEVLYPSSLTSSITHNPKYVGYDTSKPFVYAGYRGGRGVQRHRRRMADTIQEDLACMDEEVDDSDEETYGVHNHEVNTIEERDTTVLLAEILKHADNASKLTNIRVSHRKSSESSKDSNDDKMRFENKTHIVYENLPVEHDKGNNNVTTATTHTLPDFQPVSVVLPVQQVDSQVLLQTFGANFIECECFPRKFILDISEDVSRMPMFKSYNRKITRTINTVLVFTHNVCNEMNTLKEDVYKVVLNTVVNDITNTLKIETMFDYMETNIADIITSTLFFLETLPPGTIVREVDDPAVTLKVKSSTSTLEEMSSWQTDSYKPDNQFLFKTFVGVNNKMVDADESGFDVISYFDSFKDESNLDIASSNDRFCNICFSVLGMERPATCLMSCSHWFCDSCWKGYLDNRVNSGAVILLCPEYDCNREVDPGTTVSLIGMRNVQKYAKCRHDTEVERQKETRWCPNEKCGRVIRTNSVAVKSGQCKCGERLCFQCLDKPHWPAPCQTHADYMEKLRKYGDGGLAPISMKTIEVHGKNCPYCQRFVTKYGGCPSMYCLCGKYFCWGCGRKSSEGDHGNCYKYGHHDKHGTTSRTINPLDELNKRLGKNKQQWYKLALRHRMEQHPIKVREMKSSVKNLTRTLKNFMNQSERKGQPLSLDFDVQNNEITREVDKVYTFLNTMISLQVEINMLIENTAVLLNSKDLNKDFRLPLQYFVNRLSSFSAFIFALFENKDSKKPGQVINSFKEIRLHSRKTIQGLIKCANRSLQ